MTKRVLSLLLAMVMVFGLLPAMGTAAFAAAVDHLEIYDNRGNRISAGGVFGMEVGEIEHFGIQVFYADGTASYAEVMEWEVEDASAVSMTTDGYKATVKALAFGGTALTGTYRAEDGSVYTATIYIDVTDPEADQEEELPEMWLNIIDTRNNRNISKRGVGIRPGEEFTLQVKAQYLDERQVVVRNPRWVTDNPDVVYISGGQIYTSMPGTAKLSVSYTDPNGLTASAYINVKVTEGDGYYVEMRDENNWPVSMVDTVQGADFFLNAVVMDESTGELVQEPFILWRSEDDSVVEVNVDGHVWANQAGTCKIYAVYFGEDGYDYTAFAEIQATVDENLESDTVKIAQINQLDMPMLGMIPDYDLKLKYSGYTTFLPENSEYAQYVKNGIAWYDATEGKFLIPDVDVIEEDRVYDVLVFLEANEGKPFDENLQVNCSGITCELSNLEEYDADTYVLATAKSFYTVDEKADEKINAISLKLDPPAIGETPDFTAEKLGNSADNYFLGMPYSKTGFYGGIGWYDVTAGKYLSRTDVFVSGHSYRVSIAVQPGLGYDMASSEWSVPAVDITLDVGGVQTVTTECYTGTRAAKGFIITGEAMESANYYPITTEYAVAYNADGQVITKAKAGDRITVKHTGYDYQVINNWYIQPSVPVTYYTDRAVFTMPANAISVKAVFETTVISHVKVEIDFPIEGKEADFEGVVLTNGCEIGLPWGVTTFHNGIQWYDETADSYLVPGDVFEAGHSYVLSVGIHVLDFHNFNINEMTGFISGIGAVNVTAVGNQSKYYYRMLVSNAVPPAEVHDVVIHNGIAYNTDGEQVTSAVAGEQLTIVANPDPNRKFGGWVELSGHGVSIDTGNPTITLTMPNGDLELQATYADIPITSLDFYLEGYYKGNAAHQMKLTWDNWNIVSFCENCYEDQNYVICMDNNNNPSSYLYGNMTVGPYWLRVGICTSDEYTLDYLTEENITLTVDGVTMNTVRLERGDNNAMVLYFYLGEPVEVKWNILWITGGQAYFNGYPVDRAPAGAKIDLILEDTPLEGQIFNGWRDEFGYVTEFKVDANNGYSFIMPDSYVSIVPVYTGAIYRVDINMVDPPKDGMRPDYEVELPADAGYELTSDNVFNNACVNGVWWSVEYEDGSGDVLDPETAVFDFEEGKGQFYTVSFSLAAKDGYWFATNEEGDYILEGYVDGVAANLNYPDNHTKYLGVTMSFYTRDSYSITVEGGNAYNPRQQGNTPMETPITSAYPGDYIKVVADPVEGKTFSHWEIVSGTIKIAEEELANENIWFGMPEEAVALRAVFIHDSHDIDHYETDKEKHWAICSCGEILLGTEAEHEWNEEGYCVCGLKSYTVALCFGDTPVGWQTVIEGHTAVKPEDPAQENMIFTGWFTEDGKLYDFDTPVYRDINLIAGFEEVTDDIAVKVIGNLPYTVKGNMITCEQKEVCKVGYLRNGKYLAVAAVSNSDGSHSFMVPEDVEAVLLVLKGDVSGDGRVNIGDVSRLYATVKNNSQLNSEELFMADVTNDGRINIGDVSRQYAHTRGGALLSWDE